MSREEEYARFSRIPVHFDEPGVNPSAWPALQARGERRNVEEPEENDQQELSMDVVRLHNDIDHDAWVVLKARNKKDDVERYYVFDVTQ